MEMIGHLDLCGPNLIEGWLYSPDWDTTHQRLQVYVADRLIGDCDVSRFRKDLMDAGYGTGICGFAFNVPDDFAAADFRTTRLRLVGTVLHLLPDAYTHFAGPPDNQPQLPIELPEPAQNW